ncbi:MAG: phosphoglycerate mutase (2,3-diphosphoglycerate-independent) [Candidatus Heimdallarchaeota archaeon]
MEGINSTDKKYTMAAAVRAAYRAGEEDEAMEPLVLVDTLGKPVGRMENGDYVIFYNIRGEREIELTQSLTDPSFHHFPQKRNLRLHFVTMIQYDENLKVKVAFPPTEELRNMLSEVISKNRLKQVKIVESEKAIHVNYFFNGKKRDPWPLEERVIIESPKDVISYDQKPELNISAVTNMIIEKIQDPSYDLIIANYANVDVIGHIENAKAIKKAVEAVDTNIRIVVKVAKKAKITTILTADHGTAEKWLYPDGAIDTGHTDSPVPFILLDPNSEVAEKEPIILRDGGALSDVAPTILKLFELPKPTEMTGQSLLERYPRRLLPKKRVLLLILDGWGYRDQLEGNLIAQAHTPFIDNLLAKYPFILLQAAGEAVGMPPGAVGNSEAGHLHLGAGRTVYSDRVKIDKAIQNGTFFENEAFLWAMRNCIQDGSRLHLLGIISFYSSHGPVDYPLNLLKLAKKEGVPEVFLHGMLGRRGEHPESGANYVELIEQEMERLSLGKIVSLIGRFWALDREENWDRIEKTYRLLVFGKGKPVMESGNETFSEKITP